MEIHRLSAEAVGAAAPLAAAFRTALDGFRGVESRPDAEAARAELLAYLEKGWPVYLAEEEGRPIGYLVCRVDEPCVWAESLYVSPAYRRRGVASALYQKAEELAASFGEDTVYNFVHPNNEAVLAFLRARGCTVLNLIELRKPYASEKLRTKIRMGDQVFDYGGTTDILIKPMETEDEIRGKAFVHWKSWQESYRGIVDPGYLDRLTLERCEDMAFRYPENTLVAKDGGRVIGFACAGALRDAEGEGEVFALYVLEEYQRRGVGYALMKRALALLSGCRTVGVRVLKDNAKAIRFYERVGFRPDGAEQEITLGTPVKVIRMTLEM